MKGLYDCNDCKVGVRFPTIHNTFIKYQHKAAQFVCT